MYAGDLVTMAFFSIVPIGVPLIFLGLHIGVAIVQAYVFLLLASIYLSLAVRTTIKASHGPGLKFGTTKFVFRRGGLPLPGRLERLQRGGASTVSMNHPLAAHSGRRSKK